MVAVMIGIDPHKRSHTAVAIDRAEVGLGELTVRSGEGQLDRLLSWAEGWTDRTWAIENAGGLGYLLAQQLVAAGERVVDVPPKLAARARLLNTGDTNKNDPNDARSVAIVALRSPSVRPVAAEDHTAIMKLGTKRHRELSAARTRSVCRLQPCCASSSPVVWRSGSPAGPRRGDAGREARHQPVGVRPHEQRGLGPFVEPAEVLGAFETPTTPAKPFPTRTHPES